MKLIKIKNVKYVRYYFSLYKYKKKNIHLIIDFYFSVSSITSNSKIAFL